MPGDGEELNQSLEKAGRVADFLELAELMCLDALHRDGVLRRPLPGRVPDPGRRGRSATTSDFAYVAAWEFTGTGAAPGAAQGRPDFEYVHPTQRSYK